MILVTDRDALASALSRVAGIVDGKNTIPILASALLSTSDDGLKIRVTNLDMEATETIDAQIGEHGSVAVPADALRQFVRNLPEGSQVSMKLGERLAVSSGRSRINLGVLPVTHFPEPWNENWTTEFLIEAPVLAQMLSRVSFAQEKDVSRIYLAGVRMEAPNGVLRMIATNSVSLPYCDGPSVDAFSGITIPSRMVIELSRIATNSVEDVKISLSEGKVGASLGASTVISKILDPSLGYPDYARVIPADLQFSGTVSGEAMIAAIRRAMISSVEGKRQTVRVKFSSGAMSFSAHNSVSDAKDEIDMEYEGDEVDLPFNPNLLIEIIQSIPDDLVEFEHSGKNSAMIWRAKGSDDGLVVAAPQKG